MFSLFICIGKTFHLQLLKMCSALRHSSPCCGRFRSLSALASIRGDGGRRVCVSNITTVATPSNVWLTHGFGVQSGVVRVVQCHACRACRSAPHRLSHSIVTRCWPPTSTRTAITHANIGHVPRDIDCCASEPPPPNRRLHRLHTARVITFHRKANSAHADTNRAFASTNGTCFRTLFARNRVRRFAQFRGRTHTPDY